MEFRICVNVELNGVGVDDYDVIVLVNFTFPFVDVGTFALDADQDYVLILYGINDNDPATADILSKIHTKENSANLGEVNLLFFNSIPDSPVLDVYDNNADLVFDDISYGEFSTDYEGFSVTNTHLILRDAGAAGVDVASFLAGLDFWNGEALVVFSSGFINHTGDILDTQKPPLELWAALPYGGSIRLEEEAMAGADNALAQFVHNMPDRKADIYQVRNGVNVLLLNDMAYRTATPFAEIPIEMDKDTFRIFREGCGLTFSEVELELEAGNNYVIMLRGDGCTNGSMFPTAAEITYNDSSVVKLAFFNGSEDADLEDVLVDGDLVAGNLPMNEFTDYDDYVIDKDGFLFGFKDVNAGLHRLAFSNLAFWGGETA